MIINTASSKAIIDKVFRDFKPTGADWVNDAIEWIGEVCEFVGFTGSYCTKEDTLGIEGYRHKLPCGIIDILSVEYNGQALTYGSSTQLPHRTANRSGENEVQVTSVYAETNLEDPYNPIVKHRTTTSDISLGAEFYITDSGYVKTSFEQGDIVMTYTALDTDDEGFPMVPDNVLFNQAASWYILRQLMLGGYTNPNLDFERVDARWEMYLNRAGNDIAMPSPDKVEHFRRAWMSLVPNVYKHAEFFE